MSDDIRTQVRKWFVETGYVDGGGMGYWNSTKESVEVGSEAAANTLRDEWLNQGKLERTHWGGLRPNFSYGIFRIRSEWVDVPTPLADRIEELEAKLGRAECLLVDALVQLREGKIKTRRNRADLIDRFLAELKGQDQCQPW